MFYVNYKIQLLKEAEEMLEPPFINPPPIKKKMS